MEIFVWGSLSLMVSPTEIRTLSDLTTKAEYKVEEKKNGKKKPKLKMKGPGLKTLSFVVALSVGKGNRVQDTLDAWMDACEAFEAHPLYVGGVLFGDYPWVIKTVSAEDTVLGKGGELLACKMKIEMTEKWVKNKNKPNKATSKSAASKDIDEQDIDDAIPSTVKAYQKAKKKGKRR